MSVKNLCAEIEKRRTHHLTQKIQVYPRSNPIASDLGKCAREQVFAIRNWKDKPLVAVEQQARFERGKLIENFVIQELMALGLQVRVERQPFEIKDKLGRLILRGRVDGFVDDGLIERPFECKSIMAFVYQQIDTEADFQKYWWTYKYPRQLQAYLYAHEIEEGFFILDDMGGHWKLIPVALDYEEMEKILQQCESVVEHIAKGTLPDYHNDPNVCAKCWAFGRLCNPPAFHEGLQLIDDPDLESKLDQRGELEEAYRDYLALDRDVKASLKNKPGLVIGKWLVTGEEKQRKAYSVEESSYWQTKIERIDGR